MISENDIGMFVERLSVITTAYKLRGRLLGFGDDGRAIVKRPRSKYLCKPELLTISKDQQSEEIPFGQWLSIETAPKNCNIVTDKGEVYFSTCAPNKPRGEYWLKANCSKVETPKWWIKLPALPKTNP